MKNQFKKSLSLIMAVLMLMSCWVWVAPTEAEAADVNTQYYVIFKMNVKDTGDENGSTVTINFKYSNGTGSSDSVSKSYGKQGWSGDNVVIYEGYINGFPTSVSFNFRIDSTRSERHENYQLLVGKDKASCVTNVIPVDNYTYDDGDATYSKTVNADKYPVLTEGGATVSDESVSIGKIGTSTSATSKITLSGFKDQYGVAWGDLSYGFSLNAGDGVTLTNTHASISKSSNTATVTVNPAFQKLFSGKSSAKLYVPWTASTKSGTVAIDVQFPTYTATFDANGGKIGASDSDAKDKIEVTSNKMNYGSVIGKSPSYRTKDGFDFDGFYTSKNSDATGLSASFSGTKFVDDETTIPDTGDVTYYAAWKAKHVTATFLTADNQLIGTVEGRYNNYLTASNMYNGDAGLNAAVKASHTSGKVQFNSNNEPIYKDGSTTYTFAGWKIIKAYDESVMDKNEDTVLKGDVTFQATYTKADAEKYTVSFEDGNGGQLSSQGGYNYRDAVTNVPVQEPTKATDDKYEYSFIGWAKKLEGVKFFAVDENNCDEDGATIVYTSKDAAEFIVKGNATYIPVFRMTAREYDVTFKYMVDGGTETTLKVPGYHWGDTITVPDSIKNNYTANGFRYYIESWNGPATVNSAAPVLTAVYGEGVGAEYAINFYGKDTDGVTDKLISEGTYVHGSTVTAPEVAQTIDTEDALYNFAGWSPAVNTTAGGDVDYYATYTKKTYADIHFYNYDGTLIYELDGKENGLFVDEVIPEYSNLVEKEDEEGVFENVLPSKAEDVVGTYNFTGWKDGDGNVVVPGTDKFTGDLYLTAQFETVYKDYTVKFVNEGVTVSEEKYHYGEEITVPADPTRAADVEYKYDFRAWSPDVSEVCYGDATYTATYRRTPQYYKVTWLNDAKAVHTESNYQYNAKIQQAVINDPVSYGSAGEGKTWAFKHWVQCDASGNDILDADGKQIIFVRGQRMGSEHLYFYPVFEAVDNILTVKFYEEDGTSFLGEAKIPYGREISEYDEEFKAMAPKAADETNHYVIKKWVNVIGGADVTTINADVSVKATYTAEAHTKDVYDITLEPTCTETGLANVSCSEDACDKTFYNVVLDVIPDEAAPTGQIYVGTNKWTLKNYVDGIDYNDVRFVNPSTYVVVNADDLGSRSRNNPEGILSRGVGRIDYYISESIVDAPSSIGAWTNVYDYEAVEDQVLSEVLTEKGKTMQDYIAMSTPNNKEKKTIDDEVKAILSAYHANATGVLSNLNLENGKDYIIYIRVSDREVNGQSNMCYFSSGTISYGSTAAEITVSGEGYGTKFCAEAEITVTDDDDGYTVLLDGNPVDLTDGKFTCDTVGVHTVTVIDKNGNTSTKTFEIKGAHTYRNYIINASCENAGSRYDICTVCGAKTNVTEIPALGHSYTSSFVDKAPDCINDGYRTYVCDNNCGTKIVLKPTDDAETLAKAKKYVEAAEGEEEGTWVALTADDIEHLKATGEHTYAKVKDENGEETTEDAWIIDKAATCKVEGSKHKDCTKCGETVTESIPVDAENGHKFYREKVTKEPTCTEKGEKTKTCRYCGVIVKVADIDALGHTEGEYRVITAATCEAVGSQIRTCSVCGVDIGEAVEIPALGHAWKLDGEIYEGEGENAGKYYQDYVCRNDSNHTKSEVVEGYQPPVAAEVKFMNGEDVHATIGGFVGDTISAAEITVKPKKAADETKTYTFSHWEDADGKEVKFPIEVKGNATYYAAYTEKFVNYTITYYREDGLTEFKKTGYLHNGEEVTLADGPAKAETSLVKYVFAGWADTVDTDTVYTDKVTIDGANINLKATYTAVKKQYAVTYAYSSSEQIHTYVVEAGTNAAADHDVIADFGEVTKDYDSKYHYEFKAWNKAEQLKSVESNIYTTPDFEAKDHTYEVSVKSVATCTDDRVDTYTCSCGYSFDKEVPNSALGHLWGEPVYNAETGKNVVTCQREGCGVTQEDTRTFTVKFYKDAADTEAIKNISYIPWGSTIEKDVPDAPVKESTATTDYTFKGWAIKGTTAAAGVDFTKLEIKQDYEFVAMYTETTRLYNVIFVKESATDIIEIHKDVPAGSDVTFAGTTAPTKAHDDKYHYVFKGWKGYDEGKLDITVEDVQERVIVYAEFTKLEHTYDAGEKIEAEKCGEYSGMKYTCTACGYSFVQPSSKPLAHVWVVDEHKDPTPEEQGYTTYKCSACGAAGETVYHKYEDNTINVIVTVYRDGALASNIKVITQALGEAEAKDATTNKNGVATINVVKGKTYVAWVEVDGNKIPVTLVEDANGNFVGTYNIETSGGSGDDCGCACHRDNFWGVIFRFFHKIIKLFTGEFKCCGNPDPMYG